MVNWRGVRVLVDPGEAHGFHVFVHGDYSAAEAEACFELCRDARVFVDAGAHIGLFSLALARACPALRVVALEPDPAVASWCRRNLALNPDLADRIELVDAAAAGTDGTVGFAPSEDTTNVGIGHTVSPATPGAMTVRAVSLGALLRRLGLAPDVVKLDVEGAEREALGGLWTSPHLPAAILVETHAHMSAAPEAFNRELVDDLLAHGYAVARLERRAWIPLASPAELGGRSHLLARRQ